MANVLTSWADLHFLGRILFRGVKPNACHVFDERNKVCVSSAKGVQSTSEYPLQQTYTPAYTLQLSLWVSALSSVYCWYYRKNTVDIQLFLPHGISSPYFFFLSHPPHVFISFPRFDRISFPLLTFFLCSVVILLPYSALNLLFSCLYITSKFLLYVFLIPFTYLSYYHRHLSSSFTSSLSCLNSFPPQPAPWGHQKSRPC